MSKQTIVCKNIIKSFGHEHTLVQTLRGAELTARENEMIMLMGPSGSGKTTLISIIGGILEQDSGDCTILDTDINNLPTAQKTAFRGKNVGFMFQYFNLVPTLSAIENAAIPLLLNGNNRKEAFKQVGAFLEQLGLTDQQTRIPKELSGGEQQRVAITRACIHKPKIILCDEPTSFLDHARGEQIMKLLQSIKEETKCTLIVVTHDQRILKFADRILEIEDGLIKDSTHKKNESS